METKHTPGPWFHRENIVRKMEQDINFSRLICQCSHHPNEKVEAEANAKLIAAAPNLLTTIDECSNRIAYCIDLYELPEEAIAMLRGEIDAMLIAIKNAI